MRDRWVMIFAVFCFAQLPIYVWLGRGPIGYDTAIKAADGLLMKPFQSPQQIVALKQSLDDSQAALERVSGHDSRWARLDMNRAMLAWSQGQIAEADAYFRKSLQGYEAAHGPRAFYTSAVNLRYGEFLLLSRRFPEALPRFEAGIRAIEESQGPKDAFATRMVFRQVTLLSYLGRNPEAAKLGSVYLPALLEQAARFDDGYLAQTASVLDTLSRQAGFLEAPGGHGWQRALSDAKTAGKARMDGPEDG